MKVSPGSPLAHVSEMERVIEVASDDGSAGRERNDLQLGVVSM